MARALRSLGRLDEALRIQSDLRAEYARIGKTSGLVLEELAECHLALGELDAARPLFAEAHAELSKDESLVANEPDRLERLAELGRAR